MSSWNRFRRSHDSAESRRGNEMTRGPMPVLHRARFEMERQLAWIIRPELTAAGAESLYIAFASEVGVDFYSETGGMTSPGVFQLVQPSLGYRDRGAGPAMILNDSPLDPHSWNSATLLTSMAVHETGHILFHRPMLGEAEHSAALREFASRPPAECPEYRGLPLWAAHDWEWIRATLHLWHRVKSVLRSRVCWSPYLPWTIHAKAYGYCSAETYRRSLAGELRGREGIPIGEILKTNPPERFTQRWLKDVAKVETSRTVRTGGVKTC